MSKNLNTFIKEWKSKNPNRKIVATNGCFDILHIGHLNLLKKAKNFGDLLVVGLNSDASIKKLKGDKRPINKQEDRKILLEELRCVDFVEIFNETSCENFLRQVGPNFYIKSSDKTLSSINKEEKEVILSIKCKIKFVPFEEGFSSTNILNKI
jgi:rfaE bifunctional protein nucleotidyltransferase chain/domain